MVSKSIYHLTLLLGILVMFQACVEPFEFENEEFESLLVVEATVTNEHKIQEVLLSRSYPLERSGAVAEQYANVRILDNAGNQYYFNEISPGIYQSAYAFSAAEGRMYTLEIGTVDGKIYTSDPSSYKGTTMIESIYGVPSQNLLGVPGIEVRINSTGSPNNSGYYRYEYVETYKILSRFIRNREAVAISDTEVAVVTKTIQDNTCFKTENSNEILLSNSTSLNQDRVEGSFLRFIQEDNPIFSNRYSILVRQYGLSREAFVFYKSLKELSQSESLFSQIQPGLLVGNMVSLNNPEEFVLGFFSVASVTERRVYFNYTDFYNPSVQPRPFFIDPCPLETPTDIIGVLSYTQNPEYRLYTYDPAAPISQAFVFVRAACVDCTLLGTNVEPEFWED